MRNLLVGAATFASLFGASQACEAQAAQLIYGVDRAGDMPGLTPAQFVYSGRQYCWYPGGWKGPGFYWCGYAWSHGYGWGGPAGWMGYSYRGGSYYQGGAIYHGHYGHGGAVSGGSGYVYGPHGGSASAGSVSGPRGHGVQGAHVTGPHGQSRTVVRGR